MIFRNHVSIRFMYLFEKRIPIITEIRKKNL